MSKYIKFKLEYEKGSRRIKYPDDPSLFFGTRLDGDYIHASYVGDKVLEESDLFLSKLVEQKIREIKQVSYQLIAALDGQGGWRRNKAQEYDRFKGDDSLLRQLFEDSEAIRQKSNDLEIAIKSMSYEELLSLDIFMALK